MVIYLDTETTGLRPGNICQLSYLMQSGDKVCAKNFFFEVDFVEYGAFCVHGFSVERLRELSKGKRFCDCISEIEKDFEKATYIVCHNTAFDFSFLRKEFEDCNRFFNSEKGFCTMKNSVGFCKLQRSNHIGYKYPKLSELLSKLNVSEKEVLTKTEQLFKEKCGFHDARYDTTAVYMAVNRCGVEPESFIKIKTCL